MSFTFFFYPDWTFGPKFKVVDADGGSPDDDVETEEGKKEGG